MLPRTKAEIDQGKVDTNHLSIHDYTGGRLLLTYGYSKKVKLIATATNSVYLPDGQDTVKDGVRRRFLPHHCQQIMSALQTVVNGSVSEKRVALDDLNLSLHPQAWSNGTTIYLPIEAAGMDMLEFIISMRSARQIMAFLE